VLKVDVDDAVLAERRKAMDARGREGWKPKRDRVVSPALRAYAAMATSASRGAVRDVTQVEK
jgi:dihydroxy-acid dehydratase